MNGSLLWILILAAGLAVLTLTPGLARRIILLLLGEKGRAEVGQKALSKPAGPNQPDAAAGLPRSGGAGDPRGADPPGLLGGGQFRGGRDGRPADPLHDSVQGVRRRGGLRASEGRRLARSLHPFPGRHQLYLRHLADGGRARAASRPSDRALP